MSHLLKEDWTVECSNCKHHFNINAGDYQFDEVSVEERDMGPERCYEADGIEVECPACYRKFSRILLFEYPENNKETALVENEIDK